MFYLKVHSEKCKCKSALTKIAVLNLKQKLSELYVSVFCTFWNSTKWELNTLPHADRLEVYYDHANSEAGQQPHDQPHQPAHQRHQAQQDGANHQLLLQQ